MPVDTLSASAADAEFTALFRAGQLASRFPRLVTLLGAMSHAERARAGRLLARLAPEEVLTAHPDIPVVRVAITGSGTLAQLASALTAETARHGLLAAVRSGDFNSWIFDLADTSSALYASKPDLTLCVLDPTIIFDEVPGTWCPADVAAVWDGKLAMLAKVAGTHAATSRGTLVLNTLPLPHAQLARLVDQRSQRELSILWREANVRLLRLADEYPSVSVVDLEPLLGLGIPADDPRLSAYAGEHVSGPLLARYAQEIGHLARQAVGWAKKVLVLDLDGTLWGGVLGDDGPEGVEVGPGQPRGAAFAEFQRTVKQIGSQGVLLAVVSKNDADLVRRAFHEVPGMVLAEDDFVRVIADWAPKPDHLAGLARALNLDVDSFVFVDDTPSECGLVREHLPGVAVVQLDAEPALHIGRLTADGWFGVRELTAADRVRAAGYRQELARTDFLATFETVEDYLAELSVRVRLATAQESDAARLSQITLRTNQFNLTTRRLSQQDVRAVLADPAHQALAIHCRDRFGDSGLVGAVFTRRDGADLRVDNFLLSCRVFGRGVEQACLSVLLEHARDSGCTRVLGEYRPTAKNGMVADLYSRFGFTRLTTETAGSDRVVFAHDLVRLLPPPDHLALDATDLTASWAASTDEGASTA